MGDPFKTVVLTQEQFDNGYSMLKGNFYIRHKFYPIGTLSDGSIVCLDPRYIGVIVPIDDPIVSIIPKCVRMTIFY